MQGGQPYWRVSPPASPTTLRQLEPHQLTCAAIYKALVMDPGHLLVRHLPFRSTECDGTIVSGLCHSALMHEALWAAWLSINLHGCVPIMLLPNCADRGEADALIRLHIHRMNSAILDFIITLNDPIARRDSYLYLLHHVSSYSEVSMPTVREGGAPLLVMSGPNMNLLPELHSITHHLGIYENQQGPCFPYVFILLDWAGSEMVTQYDRYGSCISPPGFRSSSGLPRCPSPCGWSSRPQDVMVCGTAHRCGRCHAGAAVTDFWRDGAHSHLAGEVKYAFRTIVITEMTHHRLAMDPSAVSDLTSPPVLSQIPVGFNAPHMATSGPKPRKHKSKHKKRNDGRADGQASSDARSNGGRPARSGLSKSVPSSPHHAPWSSHDPRASHLAASNPPVQVYTMQHADNMAKLKERRSSPDLIAPGRMSLVHTKGASPEHLSDFQQMWLQHSNNHKTVEDEPEEDGHVGVHVPPPPQQTANSRQLKITPATKLFNAEKARSSPALLPAGTDAVGQETTSSAHTREAAAVDQDQQATHSRQRSRDSSSSRSSKGSRGSKVSVPGSAAQPINAPAVKQNVEGAEVKGKGLEDDSKWGPDQALMASLLNLGNRMRGMAEEGKPRHSPRRSPRNSPIRLHDKDRQATARHDSTHARRRLQDQFMRKNAAPDVELPAEVITAAMPLATRSSSSGRSAHGLHTKSMMTFIPDQSQLVPYSGSEDEDFSFVVVPPMVTARDWGGEITPSKSEPAFERLSSPDSAYGHHQVPPSPPSSLSSAGRSLHGGEVRTATTPQRDSLPAERSSSPAQLSSLPAQTTSASSPFALHGNSLYQHELLKELPTGEDEREEAEITLPAYTWSSAANGEVFEVTPNLLADQPHDAPSMKKDSVQDVDTRVRISAVQPTTKQAGREDSSGNSSGSLPSILSSGKERRRSVSSEQSGSGADTRRDHYMRQHYPSGRMLHVKEPAAHEAVDEDSMSSTQSMSYMSFPAGLDGYGMVHLGKEGSSLGSTPRELRAAMTPYERRAVGRSAMLHAPQASARAFPLVPEPTALPAPDMPMLPSTPSRRHASSGQFTNPNALGSPAPSLSSVASANSDDSTTYPPTPAQVPRRTEPKAVSPAVMTFRELKDAATTGRVSVAPDQDANGSAKVDVGWTDHDVKRESRSRYNPLKPPLHRPGSPGSDGASSAEMEQLTYQPPGIVRPVARNSSLFSMMLPNGVRELPLDPVSPSYAESPTIAGGHGLPGKAPAGPTYSTSNSYTVNPSLTPRRLKLFANKNKSGNSSSATSSVRKSVPSVGGASSTASGGGSPVWKALTKAVRWRTKSGTEQEATSPTVDASPTRHPAQNPYDVAVDGNATAANGRLDGQRPKTPRQGGQRLKQSWNRWMETAKGKVQGL